MIWCLDVTIGGREPTDAEVSTVERVLAVVVEVIAGLLGGDACAPTVAGPF